MTVFLKKECISSARAYAARAAVGEDACTGSLSKATLSVWDGWYGLGSMRLACVRTSGWRNYLIFYLFFIVIDPDSCGATLVLGLPVLRASDHNLMYHILRIGVKLLPSRGARTAVRRAPFPSSAFQRTNDRACSGASRSWRERIICPLQAWCGASRCRRERVICTLASLLRCEPQLARTHHLHSAIHAGHRPHPSRPPHCHVGIDLSTAHQARCPPRAGAGSILSSGTLFPNSTWDHLVRLRPPAPLLLLHRRLDAP